MMDHFLEIDSGDPMTLHISVYVKDMETGSRTSVKLPPGKDLGGFESYRQKFWGHDVMKSLGLNLLPTLGKGAWLNIEGNQLKTLEQEAYIIRKNSTLISTNTGIEEQSVLMYADNILYAAQLAKQVEGGVSI
jgi:hypothetical protein